MRRSFALLGAIALSLIASASANGGVPRMLQENCSGVFAVRPALVIFTCDGSGVWGGGVAGKQTTWGHFGRIHWMTWTPRVAVGLVQEWSKYPICPSTGPCTDSYVREGSYLVRLSHAVNGTFTTASVWDMTTPDAVFLSHLVSVAGEGFGPGYYLWS